MQLAHVWVYWMMAIAGPETSRNRFFGMFLCSKTPLYFIVRILNYSFLPTLQCSGSPRYMVFAHLKKHIEATCFTPSLIPSSVPHPSFKDSVPLYPSGCSCTNRWVTEPLLWGFWIPTYEALNPIVIPINISKAVVNHLKIYHFWWYIYY